VVAFRQGLKEAGFIEGQNVVIEYRSAEDRAHRLPALVADLVRQQVALIVGNTSSALAAKAATTTVPIVFVTSTGFPDVFGHPYARACAREDCGLASITGVIGG
jgi:ABC-type uncharacterized transport system substrate-binding protein